MRTLVLLSLLITTSAYAKGGVCYIDLARVYGESETAKAASKSMQDVMAIKFEARDRLFDQAKKAHGKPDEKVKQDQANDMANRVKQEVEERQRVETQKINDKLNSVLAKMSSTKHFTEVRSDSGVLWSECNITKEAIQLLDKTTQMETAKELSEAKAEIAKLKQQQTESQPKK
jgi:vacuolar-type H+-ATPase subunit I/STV1